MLADNATFYDADQLSTAVLRPGERWVHHHATGRRRRLRVGDQVRDGEGVRASMMIMDSQPPAGGGNTMTTEPHANSRRMSADEMTDVLDRAVEFHKSLQPVADAAPVRVLTDAERARDRLEGEVAVTRFLRDERLTTAYMSDAQRKAHDEAASFKTGQDAWEARQAAQHDAWRARGI